MTFILVKEMLLYTDVPSWGPLSSVRYCNTLGVKYVPYQLLPKCAQNKYKFMTILLNNVNLDNTIYTNHFRKFCHLSGDFCHLITFANNFDQDQVRH